MKLRTEDEAQSCAPIKVKLGDEDYNIPLLTVMPQREWRKKFFAELSPVLMPLDSQIEAAESMNMTAFLQQFQKGVSDGLTAALLQYPDKMIDLVFAYREYGVAFNALAKEGVTSDAELNAAFVELLAKGSLPEAEDFNRAKILAKATEEQIAYAFSALMVVAFPSLPQIEMVRNLMKSTAASQRSAKSTN